jgi:DNA-binding transcriptional LysR family regulator
VVGSPEYLRRRGHPRRPKDLADHDCLVFPFEGYRPAWSLRDRRGRTQRIDVPARIVVPEGLVLRALAVRGVGLTLLPRWMVHDELRDGSLVDVLPNHDATGTVHDAAIWLVYPSREYLPLKVRAFVDFVKRRFAGGPPWERRRGRARAR